MRRAAPNSMLNLPMVTAIEESDKGFLYVDGKPSLGHMVSMINLLLIPYSILYRSMIFIHIHLLNSMLHTVYANAREME